MVRCASSAGRPPGLLAGHDGGTPVLILRILAMLSVITVAAGFVAFLLTGQRRYLAFSWAVLKYAIIVGLLLFALLAFERVLVAPF